MPKKPYNPDTDLIPAYKEKVAKAMKNKKFEMAVNSVAGNPSEWPKPRLDNIIWQISLKEDIAGKVAATPKNYGLKNRMLYAEISAMRGEIVRRVSPQPTSSSKSASKSSKENKPTSPGISYTEKARQEGDKKLKTILANMPAGLNLKEARKYTIQAYKKAYDPSIKSAKKSAKKSTSLNMAFLPGPSELPGAMQRIPSSTFGPNKKSAKKSTTLNMNFLPGKSPLPHFMKKIPSSTGLKPNPYGKLRKKRKATKKNKPSKRSKASNKSKSSKKTRRRTRRRRY